MIVVTPMLALSAVCAVLPAASLGRAVALAAVPVTAGVPEP